MSNDSTDTWTGESEVAITQISIPECFVYKIPPMSSASGHRYVSLNESYISSHRSNLQTNYIFVCYLYIELKIGI